MVGFRGWREALRSLFIPAPRNTGLRPAAASVFRPYVAGLGGRFANRSKPSKSDDQGDGKPSPYSLSGLPYPVLPTV